MKIKFSSLILLVSVNINNSLAQVPGWVWAKTVTGGFAAGMSITSDVAGNSYVTGGFVVPSVIFGNDTLTGDTTYQNSLFTAKYDSQGNVLWAVAPTGGNNTYASSICIDAYGNSYVTGNVQGSGIITFGNITLTCNTNPAMFVVKYDNSGNAVWAKNADAAAAENRGYAISADLYGNVYVAGTYDTSITLGSFYLTPVPGSTDIFLAKYDSAGNVIWAKSAGGIDEDYVTGISTDINGNSYITGRFSNSISFGTINLNGSPNGGATVFVAKYDSSGNVIWAKSNAHVWFSSGYSNSISIDALGNSYITGYFWNDSIAFDNITLFNADPNHNDIFVVKYNTTGDVAWAKRAGTPDFDEGAGISTDANGNSYATGFFKNYPITLGNTTLFTSGYIDTYVVKYDSSGNVLWAKSAGGSLNDTPTGISVNAIGNCFVTGYCTGSPIVTFDTIALINTGGLFVAKIDTNNSANGINAITNNFTCNIFPNPFSDKLNIIVKGNTFSEINLYDITSKKLLQKQFTNSTTISTEQLSKGIYLYELRNKNAVVKKGKVVKE